MCECDSACVAGGLERRGVGADQGVAALQPLGFGPGVGFGGAARAQIQYGWGIGSIDPFREG
jgi:hypothetical protein